MSVVDRVMRAYASKHALNERQAAFVRKELSKIIDEFAAESRLIDGREQRGMADHRVEPTISNICHGASIG